MLTCADYYLLDWGEALDHSPNAFDHEQIVRGEVIRIEVMRIGCSVSIYPPARAGRQGRVEFTTLDVNESLYDAVVHGKDARARARAARRPGRRQRARSTGVPSS